MAEVRAQLLIAYHAAKAAQERLAEAHRTLANLSGNHSASLVPPELARARDQLTKCLEQIAGSLEYVDRFVAGL